MATPIVMPKLGESVVEGVIGRWLKQPGERVERDEPLAEIETDKVVTELPSPVAGTVVQWLAAEGQTVAVGQPIALVEEASVGGAPPAAPGEQPASQPAPLSPAPPPSPVPPPEERVVNGTPGRPHRHSPAVRRLAAEHHIDPDRLVGTGAGGRVTRRDVEAAIAGLGAPASAAAPESAPLPGTAAQDDDGPEWGPVRTTPLSRPPAAAPGLGTPAPAVNPPPTRPAPAAPAPVQEEEDEVLPLTAMRRTIAARMSHSKRTVPHAWTMVEVDVTKLVRWREKIKHEFRRREGVNLTYLPFVIKAAVEALREYPIMNSYWDEDRIVIKKRINIGIAVDLDDGLVVPVIHDADQKSIVGLAKAIHDLATRARAGTLTLKDVQGGTFTINNTGAFGSILSAPIINSPQAAILSMETITQRPVVVDDAIAIRWIMNLCVSMDHRVLDGAVCGRFLRSVKRRLESYDENLPLY